MTILYLGSDPARFIKGCEKDVIHFPVLEIIPRSLDLPDIVHVLDELDSYTHCIFTSKHAVVLFVRAIQARGYSLSQLTSWQMGAIGTSTAAAMQKEGIVPGFIAEEEIQEGVIARLRLFPWQDSDYVLMPRSSLARSALENFFSLRSIRHQTCNLYDTRPRSGLTLPSLAEIDEIVFTSPSTVHAFRLLCPTPPAYKKLTPLGPVTAEALRLYRVEEVNRIYG